MTELLLVLSQKTLPCRLLYLELILKENKVTSCILKLILIEAYHSIFSESLSICV